MDTETPKDKRWHVARFPFNWSRDSGPEWYLDLIVAHSVVAPLVASKSDPIETWRVNRRCDDDDVGHRFSFLFYVPPKLGESVIESIKGNDYVAKLRGINKLKEPQYEMGDHDFSWGTDKWQTPIKNAWPYFIQGVSKAWLDLIRQELGDEPITTIEGTTLKRFEQAHIRVSVLWRNDGGHAMLHHLNAIFGYEPVLANNKYPIPMQF